MKSQWCFALALFAAGPMAGGGIDVAPESPALTPRNGGCDLTYHDGTFETALGFADTALEAQFAGFFYNGGPGPLNTGCFKVTNFLQDGDVSFQVKVYDDNGPGNSPEQELFNTPFFTIFVEQAPKVTGFEVDLGGVNTDGSVYISLNWNPAADPGTFIWVDESPKSPIQPQFARAMDTGGTSPWVSVRDQFDQIRAAGIGANFGGSPTNCEPDANTLCLNDGRFRVEVDWKDFSNNTGPGQAVPFGSDDSGLFFFFSPNNWEVLVKVLRGCNINDHFWLFAAATTNVEYELRVTDTSTGAVKQYFNPLGTRSPAITDTSAFATCP